MKWYEKQGVNEDIVLFTKMSADRNINGFSFPGKMGLSEYESVLTKAAEAAHELGLKFVRADELSKLQKTDFVLHHVVPKTFIDNSDGMGLMINDDESTSIVINMRNHLHIQTMVKGSDFTDSYLELTKLAVGVESKFDIAFSERFGFLTSRPMEVGTGLKVMMAVAIPGIVKSGNLPNLVNKIGNSDWGVSAYVTEAGNRKNSCLYAIYNTATLGKKSANDSS